jgi:hypothetical protein
VEETEWNEKSAGVDFKSGMLVRCRLLLASRRDVSTLPEATFSAAVKKGGRLEGAKGRLPKAML